MSIEEKLKQLEEKWDYIKNNLTPQYPSSIINGHEKILDENWIDKILVEIEEEESL